MTHEKLLDKIEAIDYWQEHFANRTFLKALRAVVELHKPEPLDERGDVCLTCCPDLLTLYPCPTIQAIDNALRS